VSWPAVVSSSAGEPAPSVMSSPAVALSSAGRVTFVSVAGAPAVPGVAAMDAGSSSPEQARARVKQARPRERKKASFMTPLCYPRWRRGTSDSRASCFSACARRLSARRALAARCPPLCTLRQIRACSADAGRLLEFLCRHRADIVLTSAVGEAAIRQNGRGSAARATSGATPGARRFILRFAGHSRTSAARSLERATAPGAGRLRVALALDAVDWR
jgi:hypothetical protein